MTPGAPPELAPLLAHRSVRIAAMWQEALGRTGFVAASVPEVQARLLILTERSIGVLLADPLNRVESRSIGAAIAALHYIHPDALEQTQELLGEELLRELPAAAQRYLAPRLRPFLAALGAGFMAGVRTTVLAEQDAIRRAVVAERDQAYDELRAVLDAAVDAMVLISPDRRTLMINRRFTEMFDIAPDRIVGRSFTEIRPVVEPLYANPEALGRLIMRVAGSVDDATQDLIQIRPQLRTLQLHSVPVQRRDGALLGRLHIFRDVTKEREVDRREREFLAGVSHELRTPLTSIKGYVDLMLTEPLAAGEQREFLEVIQHNADRMRSLVSDLIDLSSVELGQLALRSDWLSLSSNLSRIVAALRPQLQAKDQHLSVDLPPSLPLIWGDAERLAQVFTNLLSNAHKYTPEGGGISVRAVADAEHIRVTITDTGVGMSAEEQMHLFTKFYRVRNRDTERVQGTGLGLAITRSIIELHHGTITVQSSTGAGSAFTVALPIAPTFPTDSTSARERVQGEPVLDG